MGTLYELHPQALAGSVQHRDASPGADLCLFRTLLVTTRSFRAKNVESLAGAVYGLRGTCAVRQGS